MHCHTIQAHFPVLITNPHFSETLFLSTRSLHSMIVERLALKACLKNLDVELHSNFIFIFLQNFNWWILNYFVSFKIYIKIMSSKISKNKLIIQRRQQLILKFYHFLFVFTRKLKTRINSLDRNCSYPQHM